MGRERKSCPLPHKVHVAVGMLPEGVLGNNVEVSCGSSTCILSHLKTSHAIVWEQLECQVIVGDKFDPLQS